MTSTQNPETAAREALAIGREAAAQFQNGVGNHVAAATVREGGHDGQPFVITAIMAAELALRPTTQTETEAGQGSD